MKQHFNRLELKPFLIKSLEEQNFNRPTEIQERLIPAIRNGESAIGQSQTGSGKTLAFLLPIIHRIDQTKSECQAVITAPTRELANQIYDEAVKLVAHLPEEEAISIKQAVGGTDRKRMITKMKNTPHIVIGTPGRIKDLVEEQALNVYTASMLVVDEADQMLDMGFIEDVDFIAARMAQKLQMLVFSATVPQSLQPFLKKYMNNPKFVQVNAEKVTADKVENIFVPAKYREKNDVLLNVTKAINPYLALVFTNTKQTADEVADFLIESGYNVERLHGDVQPRARKQIMKKIQRAECQYVVATDLASRGIDIKGVSHVINFELPKDLDFYIHRVGRTARAGLDGIAYTLAEPSDQQAIQKLIDKGISVTYKEVKNGEWVESKPLTPRKKPTSSKPDVFVPKPKKVKPGYKKKMERERERLQHKRGRK
ncbi:DEAD/DEAH box helicase [Guptibacillus algicola]|uniref:DEAD/DEAH box helicase n=1 Tax=Guptibacillus algicola TaxID=225844 RepID=UPI001CD70ECA|nr:DEAD/DEAH box helicase [Alkalihalobacillus algicola]MCA0986067.1 DEAD/DEAH box helicase [Alkalihalobacillus algicola]